MLVRGTYYLSTQINTEVTPVFPVKPKPGQEVPLNIMLVPNNPVPDFSKFSYDELKLRSPQFHDALSINIPEAYFLGLAKSDVKFGAIRMALQIIAL
jgi:hypothetical protein